MTQNDAPAGTSDASVITPIADLTYRHYDGPLNTRAVRWWIVALAGIRQPIRKWWFWLLVLASMAPYVFWGLILFVQSRLGPDFQGDILGVSKATRFSLVFFQAFDQQLFWLMVMGLTVGAGSIAADNRTNALQVYLAKPITKTDYLLGKWMGVFTVVFVAALLPALVLYIYCLLSYWSDGFLRQEPWLLLKIIGASAVAAAGYSSLFVGVSAWCRSTMMATALSAGLYFASGIISGILWAILYARNLRTGDLASGILIQNASVSGVIKSVAWNIYSVTIRVPGGGPRMFATTEIKPPDLWIMLTAYAVLVIAGIVAARIRIRAVEVITG
jgi:ABC-2 type transport system permease protein